MSYTDVVTLGETMVRLTPPNQRRIEQASTFDIEVGGSESNLAVGAARLGLRVTWLSRLPSSPLGRLVSNTLRGYGVDTAHVTWSASDRLGLYFLEEGAPPRGTQVIYDRVDSAMSRMQPTDLPEELFAPGNAKLLHLSGITLALSDSAYATAERALALAKAAGWTVSFDLNYRAKLWSLEEARRRCESFIQAADIFILPQRDAQAIYALGDGLSGEATLLEMGQRFPTVATIMTRGAEGAMALGPNSRTVLEQPVFPASGPGRVGGGDSFAAGFLYGYLSHTFQNVAASDDRVLAHALGWGAATAAVKQTIPGDIPVIDKQDVEALLSASATGASSRIRR
ncbi:MAG: sugar kinase [Caldilineaceae bacterium]|nr:sugar kinase [Caldilineaceae bacterium]